jgi:hypothetical protein
MGSLVQFGLSLIVPSNHSAPPNPQAIAEVRRILHLQH